MIVVLVGVALVALAGNALAVTPPPSRTPDAGSSALLLATAIAGVAAFRRFIGKRD